MARSATIVIAAICALIALSVALALTSGARSSERGATQHGAARPGQWRAIGPGGGGAQLFPAISPHDSNTVLVACDMTGAYITHDGGRSWRMFNLRAPVRFFGFDPRSANRIHAGADGLWRSDDSGSSWNIVFPPAASVTGLAMADDHASVRVLADGRPAPEVRAMAIAPNDAAHIYLAVGNQNTELVESTDAGAHWRKTADLSSVAVQHIYADPREQRLFITGRTGLNVRRAGQWSAVEPPSGATFVDISGGFTPEGEFVAYGLTDSAAFVYRGSGTTCNWRTLHLPRTVAPFSPASGANRMRRAWR